MLGSARVNPTLPVVDMERAKKFYLDTLGLKLVSEMEGGTVLQAGEGSVLLLYPRGATTADHTVAGFSVDNVEETVKEMKAKGVAFEEYDFPGLKTVDSIASFGEAKAAWFKDTEGNILGLGNVV
jgi:catechol 2,3-dioxygenase-like lactoylglutathione lyase family enzyme